MSRTVKANKSRAAQAGKQLAYSIKECAELMYQRRTKRNFYTGLIAKLQEYAKEKK
ncbi:MAG: hypothetical protein PHQ00_04965 [Phycisphaerae bacterium]|nr:hypothetical protein [Phycisphaerae bacterium]